MVFPVVGGDGKPTGYEISNSLRLTDNAYLNITRSSQSNTTGTFSAWIKPSLSDSVILAGAHTDVNNRSYFYFPSPGDGFSGGLFSRTSGSLDTNFSTSAVYRDPSAWYHLVVAFDTTQATESNRFKMYVNGEQVTSFSASTYPSQNASLPIFNKDAQTVGANYGASSISGWSHGYIAEYYYIDGTQYAASNFGETDDNGVWIPKDASGDLTFGTNGFYLEFKQTGTSQNSSGIGADTSGNDNHLAVNSLSATDVTTDTPTNNFCTLNPLYQQGSNAFSEGNCKVVLEAGDGSKGVAGGIAPANGKWYWEVKQGSATNSSILVREASDKEDDLSYYQGNFAAYVFNNGNQNITGNTNSTYGPSYSSGDIIMVAMDMDNDRVYFGKNGSWIDGEGNADEANLSDFVPLNGVTNGLGAFANANGSATATAEFNWGNPSFSISSGNSDANGYGNFEYAVPSGFYSLCTKNLAEYG